MPVYKRKLRSGRVVWRYQFDAPGSTRATRKIIEKSGFSTRKEAQEAEAARRIEEQRKYEAAKSGAGVAAAVPTTLGGLLEEFMAQHAEPKLAPKTIERYREQIAYLDPGLLAMPIREITPLHLHREWERLLERGGHARGDRTPRPLAAKSVRNIAGLVSAAFGRAVKWRLIDRNPVTHSEPPAVRRHQAVALTPEQQRTIIESATSPWCLGMFLEMMAATGARRGEVLALRRSDIRGGVVTIERSLCQTKQGLEFKGTKTGRPRRIALPPSLLARLEAHSARLDEFRRQFGPDFRADLDLLFCNPDGTPLRPDSISASVSAIFRRLGIQKPKGSALHLLRHSHASVLLAAGVPLPAVSERLGHSSPRTTQEVYSHMIAGQDEEAAQRWEEYFHRHLGTAGDGSQKGRVQ